MDDTAVYTLICIVVFAVAIVMVLTAPIRDAVSGLS